MTRSSERPPATALSLPLWVVLCALAETIGMTAASAAAVAGNSLAGLGAAGALALVVGGGLVEGAALGWFQGIGLARLLPGFSRMRWFLVTVTIAGVGWAAASAPAALAGASAAAPADAAPPVALIVVGGAGIGLVMGAVLGAVQAMVLRTEVRHPWRWIWISAAAWTPAMAIIFLGATTPDAGWTAASVILLGAATGAVAGVVLGLISGAGLPILGGPSLARPTIEWMLRSPLRAGLPRSLIVLRITGSHSGRRFDVPVQCAEADHGLIVVPARAESKTWWRNLRTPARLEILRDGRWQPAVGSLLHLGDEGYDESRAAYSERWRRLTLPADQLLVLIEPADR